jgi:hypothetical protein
MGSRRWQGPAALAFDELAAALISAAAPKQAQYAASA